MQEPHKQYEKDDDHQKMSPPMAEAVQYATGEEQRAIINNYRMNQESGPKQKWNSDVDVSGGKSKVLMLY